MNLNFSRCECIEWAIEDAVASDPTVASWTRAEQIQEGLYFLDEGYTEHDRTCPFGLAPTPTR
jgi:hypothetical protein